MATFTVTTAADAVDAGDGVLSLREAVQRANATAAADTIVFADALAGQTLTLTRGQLALTADATIDGDRGDDGGSVTVSAGGASRVLLVGGRGTDARLEDVTITGGDVTSTAGGGVHLAAANTLLIERCAITGNKAETGGGLYAGAGSSLTIRASTVSGNATTYDASAPPEITGGGLRATGGASVTVQGSSFTGNSAVSYGGGISVEDGSSLALSRTQVAGNSSGTFYAGDGGGGGLNVDRATARVTTSAIVDNFGGSSAGGIKVEDGDVALVGSTVAGNSVSTRSGGGLGGGILATGSGELSLENCTVTDNRAGIGYTGRVGGIGAERLRVANSIVSGNTEGGFDAEYRPVRVASDVRGTIVASNGHNIFGSDVAGDAPGDLEGVPPARLFARLSDNPGGGVAAANGGPTSTVALRDALDNPALSGAEPVVAGDTDQRGFHRPQPAASNPDVGSFELAQGAVVVTPGAGNNVVTGTSGADAFEGFGGADLLRGLAGDDALSGGDGGDSLRGGLGDDALDGQRGRDTASYRDAPGAVTADLAAGASSGALGRDALRGVENLEGGRFADAFTGDALANALGGRAGADRLFGRAGDDALFGGTGNDRLNGASGRDAQTGGAGADVFDYDRPGDSTVGANRDVIADFAHLADRIDLSTIDARVATPGANDAFVFRAAEGAAFTGAGQVRWFQEGGDTLVEANVDADRAAELQVELAGLRDLTAADFVL